MRVYRQMRESLHSRLEASGTHVIRMNVSFGESASSGISNSIGKAAHIQLIECATFLQLLVYLTKPYFSLD